MARTGKRRGVMRVRACIDPGGTESRVVGGPEAVQRIVLVAVGKQLHAAGALKINDFHVEGFIAELIGGKIRGGTEPSPDGHGVFGEADRGAAVVHELVFLGIKKLEARVIGNAPGIGSQAAVDAAVADPVDRVLDGDKARAIGHELEVSVFPHRVWGIHVRLGADKRGVLSEGEGSVE